ncbi:hypothetical protein C7401_13379 [Paraburkholderia unamae]|uniref:hypothetical protein n=1 Tax=Paraburkholderia unamae TaxID=219649 RepID=UPI000DC380FD|nr:hypothetical protein [Paraburkholderia unamae]RAR52280.1 hypothetical protein C7401_13379 [Paraburkholderia unamae]
MFPDTQSFASRRTSRRAASASVNKSGQPPRVAAKAGIPQVLLSCVFGWGLLLSGCHSASDSAPATAGSVPITVKDVRDALDQKNYGQAATLARQLTDANAHDVDAWMADADANAAAGNRLEALTALSHAFSNGLRDTTRLDADGYLAPLRTSDEYNRLLAQYGLTRPVAQAGDTSISETSNGAVVRAGDVSVSLPDSK